MTFSRNFQNPFKMRQVLECTFFRCKRAKPIRIQFTPTLNHMVLGKFFWFPANLCKNIHWIENHNCTLYTVFYNLGNYGFKVINSLLDQDEATLPLADKTPAVTATILEWAVEWSLFICPNCRCPRKCAQAVHFSFALFFQNFNKGELDHQHDSTKCWWPNTPFNDGIWDFPLL